MPTLPSTLRLREHRERLGLTQSELADRLTQMAWARERTHVGVNSDMVSKWERGIKQPSKLYRRLLSLTLDASPHELGLLLGAADLDAGPTSNGIVLPGLLPPTAPDFTNGAVNPDVITQVDSLFATLVAMDDAVGARLAVGAAAQEATILERLSAHTRSPLKHDLQLAAARFAELTGWLHQDLGDLEGARQWTERAMDLAVLHGERQLTTYIRHTTRARRSAGAGVRPGHRRGQTPPGRDPAPAHPRPAATPGRAEPAGPVAVGCRGPADPWTATVRPSTDHPTPLPPGRRTTTT